MEKEKEKEKEDNLPHQAHKVDRETNKVDIIDSNSNGMGIVSRDLGTFILCDQEVNDQKNN